MNTKTKIVISIVTLLVYSSAMIYLGYKLGYKPCAPCAKTETKSETDKSMKAHVVGSVKKKCDPTAPGGGSVDIDFTADIESFLRQRTATIVTPPSYPRGDNWKLNINSKLQTGIEIMPKDHHWLGYSRDLRTQENIYQYSYSNRIGIFD